MLSFLLLVTLAVALLSLVGVGAVSGSVRFLLDNPPLFAFTVLVLCILAPSHDGHACEQLDESGRLLPCYPRPDSKYVGQMCRAAERRRFMRRLWRKVEYVLGKFLGPLSTGVQEVWPWVSHLCKHLRDGAPVFLEAALPVARAAYASTEARRVVLAVCVACFADYLVRYAFVPEVAALLVSACVGCAFRESLWKYLKSTGPVLSYLDCYNQLTAQPERGTRKGNKTACLAFVKHQKHESATTRQPTNIANGRATASDKAHTSPALRSYPTSTNEIHKSKRRAVVSAPAPIQSTTDEKRKKLKRAPKAKVAALPGAHESRHKITNQKPKDELVGKSATCITIPNSEPPYEKTLAKTPASPKCTSKGAVAENVQDVARTSKATVDPPQIKPVALSYIPNTSSNPATSPIIISDRCSETKASQPKGVDQNKVEENPTASSAALEIKASESNAIHENATRDDAKQANKNISFERGASVAAVAIVSVPQTNSVGGSCVRIPTVPSIPPISKGPSQAEPTLSTTDKVTSAEQPVRAPDEIQSQPQPLSSEFGISQATRAPTPAITDAPPESGHSICAPTNSSRPGAPVATMPGGKSPRRASPKRKNVPKSSSHSTSRVLRLYAPIPRFQVKNMVLTARLKKKHALKKAKLGRQSKRLAAAAAPPRSMMSGVATQVQPPPTAVPGASMPATFPLGLGPAGNTAMEVCKQSAAIGSAMNASLDPMDAPMSLAESGPVVDLPVVESPLPTFAQPTLLAPIAVASQVVVSSKELAPLPAIAPHVPLSIPCKPVDASSFFKPYKPARVPRPVSLSVSGGLSGVTIGESTPQAVPTTPLAMPTTGDLSHPKQHAPALVARPVTSPSCARPVWASAAGQVPAPKPIPTKPAPALKTGSTVVHGPAEEELIAAFKQSSGQSKSSKLTETDLDYKLVMAPSAPGACRQLGRVETKKNVAPRKNVVYSMDAQGKNRVMAGEVGRDAYVYKWNLDLGTPGVRMRAPEELWKA